MRALVVENGKLTFDPDRRLATRPPGEVRVDVILAGICATDLEILNGYMHFSGVPGHEFIGVARNGALGGARVVGEINAACRRCERCDAGLDRHCANRTVLGILGRDGAFAESLLLPEVNLRPVPDSVSDEAAVFAEPLAAALAILEQCPIDRGARVAVLGDGKLGLLCALACLRAGARVDVLGKNVNKLEIARAAGAGIVCINEATGEENMNIKYPIVVEPTGSASGLARALALAARRGTLKILIETGLR